MARSAKSYRHEAERLHAAGLSYAEITARWVEEHRLNPRVSARLAHGLTQQQVADQWNSLWPEQPVTAKNLSYWESWPQGGRAPSVETLNKLALVYRVRAGDLLGGADYSHLDEAAAQQSRRSPVAQVLSIALGVVLHGGEVLLVSRRQPEGELRWGFPAGVVKRGVDAAGVAVSETLNETGVHCRVTESLGTRLHPLTGAWASYFRCSYLAGDAVNGDPVENSAVTWVPAAQVGDFIPLEHIFGPVHAALEGSAHVAAAG